MLSQIVFVPETRIKQAFHLFGLHEISVLVNLTLEHLRYHLTEVPHQPNSPPDCDFRTNQSSVGTILKQKPAVDARFSSTE